MFLWLHPNELFGILSGSVSSIFQANPHLNVQYFSLICQPLFNASIFISILRTDKQQCKGTTHFLVILFQVDLSDKLSKVLKHDCWYRGDQAYHFAVSCLSHSEDEQTYLACSLKLLSLPSTFLLDPESHSQMYMLISTTIQEMTLLRITSLTEVTLLLFFPLLWQRTQK